MMVAPTHLPWDARSNKPELGDIAGVLVDLELVAAFLWPAAAGSRRRAAGHGGIGGRRAAERAGFDRT